VRLEGLDHLKNPVISSRMKPATFRLVEFVGMFNNVCEIVYVSLDDGQ
jgi:hypothetical protein